MATKYFALLTNIGAAKLANATALGAQVQITHMAVGDGNGTLPTPNPAQTALAHEQRRAQLNMLTIDPVNTNQIIAEQVIPEDAGGWWIREIGLFDKDGDMVAVANCAETYKPQLQEGSGRVQVIRVILIVSSTEAVTLKIDPSVVLATRKYADDKAIEVKAYADSLMTKHLAAEDPHPKYAPVASPALTGTPKAPTPPLVANDTQIATAEFVQALAALKQPLNQTLTDLSGKDVAGILQYLGLGDLPDSFGTAAAKNVGTGAGQLPDSDGVKSIVSGLALGVGQTWSSTPRALDTTYTNSTGRPIFILIYLRSLSNLSAVEGVLTTGGVQISFAGGGVTTAGAYKPATLGIPIPAGATYSLSSITSGAGIAGWWELR